MFRAKNDTSQIGAGFHKQQRLHAKKSSRPLAQLARSFTSGMFRNGPKSAR